MERSLFRKYIKKIKESYISEILSLHISPHSLALGFAVGTFIEILPTPGINMLLALLVVLIYPKISKITMFGAIIIWNPIFTFPLYALSYKLGEMMIGEGEAVSMMELSLANIKDFPLKFLAGNIVIAVSVALLSYLAVFLIAYFIQKGRKNKENRG